MLFRLEIPPKSQKIIVTRLERSFSKSYFFAKFIENQVFAKISLPLSRQVATSHFFLFLQ